jgi:hypothetical protein
VSSWSARCVVRVLGLLAADVRAIRSCASYTRHSHSQHCAIVGPASGDVGRRRDGHAPSALVAAADVRRRSVLEILTTLLRYTALNRRLHGVCNLRQVHPDFACAGLVSTQRRLVTCVCGSVIACACSMTCNTVPHAHVINGEWRACGNQWIIAGRWKA